MATMLDLPERAQTPYPEPQLNGDRCDRLPRLYMRVHRQDVYRLYNRE